MYRAKDKRAEERDRREKKTTGRFSDPLRYFLVSQWYRKENTKSYAWFEAGTRTKIRHARSEKDNANAFGEAVGFVR